MREQVVIVSSCELSGAERVAIRIPDALVLKGPESETFKLS